MLIKLIFRGIIINIIPIAKNTLNIFNKIVNTKIPI